jgi:hypothetical protein
MKNKADRIVNPAGEIEEVGKLAAEWIQNDAKRIAELEKELAAAKRGEFICTRCSLRQDGLMEDAGF